jgi:hypothetical protein
MRVDIYRRGDRAMATLEIKEFILEWLIKFGLSDIVLHQELWDEEISGDYALCYFFCVDAGLLDEVQDAFTKVYSTKLTEKGLDYVSMQ